MHYRSPRSFLYEALLTPTVLTVVGIVMLFSCISFAMLYSAANGNIHPWAMKQLITFAIFTLIMLILRVISIRAIYQMAYYIYAISLVALIIAEVIGYTAMGAQRWLRIGALNIQPSEFAKIGIILALARYFQNCLYSDIRKVSFLIVPTILVLLPAALILKQPNLSTTLIIIMIAAGIYFISGVNKWLFIIPGFGLILSIPFIWHFLHDYQKKRILTFINPENDLLGAGYNIAQSKIAIGAGGLWGKGFMGGTQNQLSFLPEKHTDFIFTLLAEEWGFMGFCTALVLYTILIIVCYRVSFNALNHFGRVVVIGVAAMIFLHLFVNIGMISGILPAVGTPIPLLSYGGSNLAATLIGLGLVLNIDKSYRDGIVKL